MLVSGLVRRSVSITALVALLLSFATGSFSHLHTQGLDHSQVSGPVHAHLRLHVPSSGTEIAARTADDDAVDLAWNVVSPAGSLLVIGAEIQDALQIPVPSVSGRITSAFRLHLNDPPPVSPRQTRAPPVA